MHIGVLTVALSLPEASSLKEKRSVLKGTIERARRLFGVSMAEVDEMDAWRRAVIGAACVSNSADHANRILDKLLDWLEAQPGIEVGDVSLEML